MFLIAERKLAVEERKRLILEAEQDRKQAILRKNEERDFKLEAKKRNQQLKTFTSKNEIPFAFGSSLPRSINLDQILLGQMRSYNRLLIETHDSNNGEDSFQSRRPVSCIFNDEQKGTH